MFLYQFVDFFDIHVQDRMVLSSGLFWFGLILIPITALLLDLVFEM